MLVEEGSRRVWYLVVTPWTDANKRPSSLAESILICLFIAYGIWHLWRFTILPALRPAEPKDVPYWIPGLGHALSFFKDSNRVLTNGRLYFQNTREPFALTLAGEKLYVLTSPKDVAEAFRNTSTLSHDGFVSELMLAVDTNPRAVDKMYEDPEEGGFTTLQPNPHHKALAQLTTDFHKTQLLPGEQQDDISAKFLASLNSYLFWQKLSGTYVLESKPEGKTISLLGLCTEVLLTAATNVYFGEKLLQSTPDLPKWFFDFDSLGWMLVYRYPKMLSKGLQAAKQNIIGALTNYFDLPKEQRTGETWFVRTLEAEQRQLGMKSKDIASLMMLVYWGVNTNTFKLCFWYLAYLSHNPALLETVRNETSKVVRDDSIDLDMLMNDCPQMEAMFHEVMRMTTASSAVRRVSAPTPIGSKVLSPGYRVIVPYRQLHFNEEVYGNDAFDFDAERFLKSKELSHSPSFRPFGGGANYCPGRFIARQEVCVTIACILTRFDISLAANGVDGKTQRFPRTADGKPCLGIMGSLEGDDVILNVKQLSR